MDYRKIESLSELKKLASGEEPLEGFISLAIGRSSKRVSYNEGGGTETWWVANEIDDTEDYFSSDEELSLWSNIPEAIEKGCFYCYIY